LTNLIVQLIYAIDLILDKDIKEVKNMKKQRIDGQETRNRLLLAAGEVFAMKGFRDTTNADICEKAQTNTAAVNYHFGSKENLYVEAWKYSFERSIEKYPPDGGVSPEAAIKERLYGRILSFMHRIADPETHDVEIMHKEMANPTGLLTEAIEKIIEPTERDFRSIFQELLGEGASKQQVIFCQMSVMGQCFGPMLHLRHCRAEPGKSLPGKLPMDFCIEELADHITLFSLVGINGIHKEIELSRQNCNKHS
jgi:TetR/AcrR family transcriptional regulator, regulator of cefoperazone and chloramphenicol sensitivity